MSKEFVKFITKDEIVLNGYVNKCEEKTNKLLIQIHGMTSNCFKKREEVIAKKIEKINIDTLCFNNRGSEIIKYAKKVNGEKFLAGTAYENIEDSYYDVVGAIEYGVKNNYTSIYLQGHSLGSTKIVYVYNKMKENNDELLKYIDGIILLSLVDVAYLFKMSTKDEYVKYAIELEEKGKKFEIMPIDSFMHLISVKNFLQYTRDVKIIDFAKYNSKEYDFKELNNINIPLFMRWGNNNEYIYGDADELVNFLKTKINKRNLDINFVDGANHSYSGKEEILAEQICCFLERNS